MTTGADARVMFAELQAERFREDAEGNVDLTRFGTIRLIGQRGALLVGTLTCLTCGDVGQYAFRGGDVLAFGPVGITFVASSRVRFRVRAVGPDDLDVICQACEAKEGGTEAQAENETTPAPDDFELEFDEKAKEFVIYCRGGIVARAELPPETVADALKVRFAHVTRQPLLVVYQVPVIVNDHQLIHVSDEGLTELVSRAVGAGVEVLLEVLRTRRAGMRAKMNVPQLTIVRGNG